MNNDVLKLIEKLNKLNEEQIIKSFKASKNLDITKELFNYYCENNFALALKIYQNVDVRIKDAIKDVLFSHLNEFNKDVVMSLYLLGKDYQITYFKKHLIDVSLYDDFIYDVKENVYTEDASAFLLGITDEESAILYDDVDRDDTLNSEREYRREQIRSLTASGKELYVPVPASELDITEDDVNDLTTYDPFREYEEPEEFISEF